MRSLVSTSRSPTSARRGSIRQCCRSTGLGTSASTSTARTSKRPASCPAPASSCRLVAERYYAVAARTFADATAGRHHPLRGRLPEHLDRDQRRQRSGDVRRSRKVRTFEFTWTRFEPACSRPEVRAPGDERRPTQPVAVALLPAARAQAVRRDRRELGHDARSHAPRPVRSCARCGRPCSVQGARPRHRNRTGRVCDRAQLSEHRGGRSRSRRRDARGSKTQDAAGARRTCSFREPPTRPRCRFPTRRSISSRTRT